MTSTGGGVVIGGSLSSTGALNVTAGGAAGIKTTGNPTLAASASGADDGTVGLAGPDHVPLGTLNLKTAGPIGPTSGAGANLYGGASDWLTGLSCPVDGG